MIGNDIVDLELARTQSNWQRKGWLQKLFTQKEQQHILSSADPTLQVWILWSRKEAAYKAHQRRFGLKPRYNPKKIECGPKESLTIDGFVYQVVSQCTPHYAYSVAKAQDNVVHSEIFETKTNIRAQLKKTVRKRLGEPSLISFERDRNGIPIMRINEVLSNIPFSFTHHGRYSAYLVKA